MGHGHELDVLDPPAQQNGHGDRSSRLAAAAARNRARLAAARGDGPPPEAQPLDPAAFAQLTGALGARQ